MKILNVGIMVQGEPYRGLEKELFAISSEYKSIKLSPQVNVEMLECVKNFTPDIIFMQIQRENIVSVETVKKLHDQGFKIINWTGDVRTPIPQFYFDLAPYCTTAFSNMTDVITMRDYGFKSEFLQIGYDQNIFNKKYVYKDLDIVFLGTNYGAGKFPLSEQRIEMVHRMKKEFGERFRVYGSGWGNLSSGNITDQNAECDIYNRAKIGINFSHFNYSRYSSDRIFRLMGSGCFCLTHKYQDINDDFPPGVFSTWESIDELIEKCHIYLGDHTNNIINSTSNSGYRYVNSQYTYKQMAENIFKL
jgi:spore maturation protein CgeB